jgi:hypothetical protein
MRDVGERGQHVEARQRVGDADERRLMRGDEGEQLRE